MGYQNEKITIAENPSFNQINLYYAELSTIFIRYVDINTGDEISDRVYHTDTIGSEFNIASDKKIIPGYELVREPAVKTGTYKLGTQGFTYYYSRQSSVVVKYLEKDTNEVLSLGSPRRRDQVQRIRYRNQGRQGVGEGDYRRYPGRLS